ncbi:ClpP/crotonase-like domain-containing protein [Xylaria bambusicola]|uniref:ClpP/crotonase-like domain-containing protein n=1 Tax=Xylaria bambusicola TaxID=326684 RepID=UPI0020078C55|nr:ClpP/crotonase-like domain-containing protein [Xylaria bambusicola]KAI0527891.1 ClpP/crotonase-like domain-containing protein [Xylaria bambusicola]
MAEKIKVSYSGRIATITIDNEKKLGALDLEGYYALAKAMREVAARHDIYITILTGKGRYFSAGADVSVGRSHPPGTDLYKEWLRSFVSNNLNITQAFYSHPKVLIVALNGPAVGLSAALTGFADFVYAAPHTFLLTPFSSLGLVAEGGASQAFVQRLGISKANEALIMSKRISVEELVATGYVNKVFECEKGDDEGFMRQVLHEVDDRLGEHLVGESLTGIKALIRKPEREILDRQTVAEVFAGLNRFTTGVPQGEFQKLASGQKRHKL